MDQELRDVLEGIKRDIAEFRAESAEGQAGVKEALLTLARMVVPLSQVREVESKLRRVG